MSGSNIRQKNNQDKQSTMLRTSTIPSKSEKMQVIVETIVGTQIKVFVYNTDPVLLVKNRLYLCSDIPIVRQRLVYGNEELEDFRPLYDYSIKDGSVIKLILQMRGGPITSSRRSFVLDNEVVKNFLNSQGDVDSCDTNKLGGNVNERNYYNRCGLRNVNNLIPSITTTATINVRRPAFDFVTRITEKNNNEDFVLYSPFGLVQEDQRRFDLKMKENTLTRMKMDKLKKDLQNDIGNAALTHDTISNAIGGITNDISKLRIYPPAIKINESSSFTSTPLPSNFGRISESTPSSSSSSSSSFEPSVLPNLTSSGRPFTYENILLFDNLPYTRPAPCDSYPVQQPFLKEFLTHSNPMPECFQNNRNTVCSAPVPRVSYAGSSSSSSSSNPLSPYRTGKVMMSSEQFRALVEQDIKFSKDLQLLNEAYKITRRERRKSSLPLEEGHDDDDDDERFSLEIQTDPSLLSIGPGDVFEIIAYDQPIEPIAITTTSAAPKSTTTNNINSDITTTTTISVRTDKRADKSASAPLVNNKSIKVVNINSILNSNNNNNNIIVSPTKQTLPPIQQPTTSAKTVISNNNNNNNNSNAVGTCGSSATSSSMMLEKPRKQKHRCCQCNKKLRISATYMCHCKLLFCPSHRYSETHNCTYDYKVEGRKVLQRNNPLVVAEKLPKI